MNKYPDYISEARRAVPTPKAIVENGKCHFGTFSESFEKLNLLDCEQPCGFFLPHFLNRVRLTEWEAFEINMDEGMLISAVYNTGTLGFSIMVFFDKRKQKIFSWKNFVPAWKAKVAKNLLNGVCHLKTKNSEYTITNDLGNGKAHAKGFSTNKKSGSFEIDMSVEKLAPCSNVSIPFGKNKPLYSEKDFLKATGYIKINDEKFETNERSVSIIDDHKGFYPFFAHYDWLTTMGMTTIDGEEKYFAFNLTRNQSIDQDKYNENCIWLEGESCPLPPVVFKHDEAQPDKIWYIKDEHGCVDIRFEIADTFKMPINAIVIAAKYDLPFGKIYGFVKDVNGKKYVVDGLSAIGEDKTTRM